jgi:hypothetical protein
MRRLPIFLALAIGTLLAGCFASDRPMFSAASAVPALGDGGRYVTFELDQGKSRPSDPIAVRPRPDGGYDFVNEKGHATPVTFHPIAGGMHVAQVRLGGGQGYGYVVARIAGNEVVIIPAECARQDKAKMDALGVVQRNQYECRIDRVADPAAFFAGLNFTPPVSKMVRE